MTLAERVIAAVEGCPELDREIATLIVAGIRTGSVDRALGIVPCDPSHALIRNGVRMFYRGMKVKPAADDFHSDLLRFAGSAWRNEKHLADCPHQAGTLRATFWQILKHRDKVLSARQIRRILSVEMATTNR